MRLDPQFESLARALREMEVELNLHRFDGLSEIPPELKERLENENDDFEGLDEIRLKGGVRTFGRGAG